MMPVKAFRRELWLLLAGLVAGLLAAAAIIFLVGLPAPILIPENGLVGASGPIELNFREDVRSETLTGRVTLLAADGTQTPGRLEVANSDGLASGVRFWPDSPLTEGKRYVLSLAAGVQSQRGLALRRPQNWVVQVRPAEIIYLSSADAPDLWAALPDGSLARQVTSTGGRIFDYDVPVDGSQIFYSARNEQAGIDLWRISRSGGQPELLLPCRSDWCFNPAIAPDGQRLVYNRRQAGALAGQEPGLPQLWSLDLNTRVTDLLLPDPNVAGFQPVWSPDGRFLAFNDARADQLYVIDWQAGTLSAHAASLNGPISWFADGQRLFMSSIQGGGDDTRPFVQVFALDVQTGLMEQVLGEDFSLFDYSLPIWSPDGEWLAVALRRVDAGPGKGLWRMHLDGTEAEQISQGDIYAHGAYSWDLHGQRLVFQRLALNSSSSRPDVLVWNAGLPEPVLVAEDAVLPRWLP